MSLKKVLKNYFRENKAFRVLSIADNTNDGIIDSLNKGVDIYPLTNPGQIEFKKGDNLIGLKVDDREMILGYSPFITGYNYKEVE